MTQQSDLSQIEGATRSYYKILTWDPAFGGFHPRAVFTHFDDALAAWNAHRGPGRRTLLVRVDETVMYDNTQKPLTATIDELAAAAARTPIAMPPPPAPAPPPESGD